MATVRRAPKSQHWLKYLFGLRWADVLQNTRFARCRAIGWTTVRHGPIGLNTWRNLDMTSKIPRRLNQSLILRSSLPGNGSISGHDWRY